MGAGVTRSQLLSGAGVRGGAALVATGSVLGALADGAAAAPPSDALGTLAAGDLAYVRLLIGVELLAVDFYTHAVGSGHLHAERFADARVALVNESEHYTYLAGALTSAGDTPLTAADINFSYPAGSFYTAASVTGLAVVLELLSLGAYLGAAKPRLWCAPDGGGPDHRE